MVNVGEKPVSERSATAEGWLHLPKAVIADLAQSAKGNAYEVARLAGIMAAKKTADLIPLCHSLALDQVHMEFEPQPESARVRVVATARCHGRTGVEMEALTAVSVALLTLYDMTKSRTRDLELGPIRLLEKHGGRTGHWQNQADPSNHP